MKKIIYIFFIFFVAFEIKATENLSGEKKNIKDILLDISEKIESLEKTFLLPDNGFIGPVISIASDNVPSKGSLNVPGYSTLP